MPITMTTEQPTLALRFIKREGRFILQQAWRIDVALPGRTATKTEWRDIPLVTEDIESDR